ncbi:hypothetical protein SK128_026498 [Halocaridina rubra]|uniref:Uncharacterized protein n=1 Tax=Halocaridina rubra TaxID=373956 RepID=A0AAN8WJ66_HALRR
MAWTGKQLLLAFVMVSTGSLNTLSTKLLRAIYRNCNEKHRYGIGMSIQPRLKRHLHNILQ